MRHFLMFSHTPYLEMRRNRIQHVLVILFTTPIFHFKCVCFYVYKRFYLQKVGHLLLNLGDFLSSLG